MQPPILSNFLHPLGVPHPGGRKFPASGFQERSEVGDPDDCLEFEGRFEWANLDRSLQLRIMEPDYPSFEELFLDPDPLREIIYPRYTDEPQVQCPHGKDLFLSRLPWQSSCNCGSCGAKGWPQWMIRDYHRSILNMAVLPWADQVKPQFRYAQWRHLKHLLDQPLVPPDPQPKAAAKAPPAGFARPPADYTSLPCLPLAPKENERAGYAVKLLECLDPDRKHQEFVQDISVKDLNKVDLRVELSEIKQAQSFFSDIKERLEKTIMRLQADLPTMESDLDQVNLHLSEIGPAKKKLQERHEQAQRACMEASLIAYLHSQPELSQEDKDNLNRQFWERQEKLRQEKQSQPSWGSEKPTPESSEGKPQPELEACETTEVEKPQPKAANSEGKPQPKLETSETKLEEPQSKPEVEKPQPKPQPKPESSESQSLRLLRPLRLRSLSQRLKLLRPSHSQSLSPNLRLRSLSQRLQILRASLSQSLRLLRPSLRSLSPNLRLRSLSQRLKILRPSHSQSFSPNLRLRSLSQRLQILRASLSQSLRLLRPSLRSLSPNLRLRSLSQRLKILRPSHSQSLSPNLRLRSLSQRLQILRASLSQSLRLLRPSLRSLSPNLRLRSLSQRLKILRPSHSQSLSPNLRLRSLSQSLKVLRASLSQSLRLLRPLRLRSFSQRLKILRPTHSQFLSSLMKLSEYVGSLD